MTTAILGILYNKPYDFPKKSIAYSLLDAIDEKGITKAFSSYKEIKDSGNYYLNENEMNLAGYQLLQSNRATEAASVFKLNVEAFPHSFNVYYSYGEALLALGDTVQSIENYKESVKLNPGNGNGLKVLKDLDVNVDTLIKKVPLESLKLLEGEYIATNPPADKEWKIQFKVVNGELTGNDGGYHYRLIPVEENAFVNPDDNASLIFDTNDKNAITLLLFGKYRFRKVI